MSDVMDRTLIVGASGRVGSLVSRAWQRAGQLPLLQHRGRPASTMLRTISWSPLLQPFPIISEKMSAMIILAGAVPGHGEMADNARLAEACLQVAAKMNIPRVLLASSSAVYGANSEEPFCENSPVYPINEYGMAKVAAENVAEQWRRRGLRVTCLRIGNVAGADALLTNPAYPVKIDQFSDGGAPVRSYIGPLSLARILAELLDLDLPDILNVAAPVPVSMSELASAAFEEWRWQPAPNSAQQYITLNCGLLASLVVFSPVESRASEMVKQWHALREV